MTLRNTTRIFSHISVRTDNVQADESGVWSQLFAPIAAPLAQVTTLLSDQARDFDPALGEYLKHVLGTTGKQLRPALTLLAGGATGRITEEHIRLGAIVELIHLGTLVHDDILDEAALRHGLPTTNAKWGNKISVLLGDGLFAHALHLAASYPTTTVCRKIGLATKVVCTGEILQTQRRFDPELAITNYLEIIGMKTGILFAVSTELGAELNAAPAPIVEALQEFGNHFGIAYQIYDDCVDIFGQEGKAGKSLGTDMRTGKLTLPWLLLLEHTAADRRSEITEMIFRGDAAERAQLFALAADNGVLAESLATVDEYITRAGNQLADLPDNIYTKTLTTLLDRIADKTHLLLRT